MANQAQTDGAAEPATDASRLKIVGILSVGEAGDSGDCAGARNLDPHRRLGLRAGLAEKNKAGQRFVVNLSDQIVFAGVVLLPDLADLNLSRGHITNVARIPESVNMRKPGCFPEETPRQPPTSGKLISGMRHHNETAYGGPAGVYNADRFLRRYP
jgi:hypothetical protein